MQDICYDAQPLSAVITFSARSIQLQKARRNSFVEIPFKISVTTSRRLISSGISYLVGASFTFPKRQKSKGDISGE
jgi:hypothetical protein